MPDVKVYTRTTCGPCKTVKYFLTQKGISFTEINVDDDPRLMDEVLTQSGFMQVPLTMINGKAISGANIGLLNSALVV